MLTYTQWNRDIPRLAVATSRDLVHWTNTARHGKCWMYFNVPDILIATSDNLVDWILLEDAEGKPLEVLSPRRGHFDSWLVEAGPPAVLTRRGIILLYNAGNSADSGDAHLPAKVYTGGQALFDARDPTKLVARSDEPFIQPTEEYGKTGQYPEGTNVRGGAGAVQAALVPLLWDGGFAGGGRGRGSDGAVESSIVADTRNAAIDSDFIVWWGCLCAGGSRASLDAW